MVGRSSDEDGTAIPTRSVAPQPSAVVTLTHHSPTLPIGPGVIVDRFRIVDELGRGGMGRVYRAHDPELDREVAIKVLQRAGSVDDEARFVREARAMAKLNHPNILPVFHVGATECGSYIAMQLVEGQTLRRWLAVSPRSWQEILPVAIEAGRGLMAAHEAGLVHRDFKASNVMVSREGRVLVMDFGLVRSVGDVASDGRQGIGLVSVDGRMTATGSVLGTPPYMAPEQHMGQEADARSDLYAYCVTLWEAVHGARPFAGESFDDLLRAKLYSPPRAADPRRVPRWLNAALRRGLAPEPEDRFATMAALLDVLDRGSRPRGDRWRVAAVVGAGIVAAGLASGRTVEVPTPCSGASQRLDGAWDQERRAAVRSALLGTTVSYASDTWQRVEPLLDDYAAQWERGHAEACAATRVDHQQTEATLDARMRCLDGRLRDFRALVGTLEDASAPTVSRAVEAVRRLPSIEACADLEYVAAQVPLPEDPGEREQVEAIDELLAQAKALQSSGRYREALQVAVQAHAAADRQRHGPVKARATIREATLHRDLGSYPEAAALFEDAYFEAGRWAEERVRAEAAMFLADLHGNRLQDRREAQTWIKHAEAEVARLGDLSLEGGLLELQGSLALQDGRFEEAEAVLRGALTTLEQSPTLDELDLAACLATLANLHIQRQQLDEALAELRRELAIREQALGPSHPAVAITVGNVGVALLHGGKIDEALPYLERALAIQEDALGPEHPAVAGQLGNIAVIHATQGRSQQALAGFERVLAIQQAAFGPDHPTVADSLNNLGALNRTMGRHDEARGYFERALVGFEHAKGPMHPSLVTTLTNIGTLHRMDGRLEDALPYFERAVSIVEASFDPMSAQRATAQVELADTLHRAGNPQAALERLETALAIYRGTEDARPDELARACFSLAVVLGELGRDPARARALAEEARKQYEQSQLGHDAELTEIDAWLAAHRG